MKRVFSLALLLIFWIFPVFTKAQKSFQPLEIKSSKDYIHPGTKVVFPTTLLGFKRKRIIAYDKSYKNIGASYELKVDKKPTAISIYIYPAEISNENLREQFFAFNAAVQQNSPNLEYLKPQLIKLSSEKSTVNGILSTFDYDLIVPDFFKGQREQNNKSLFSVYDCGKWNIKFRITSEGENEARLLQIEKLVVTAFDPAKIAEENLINIGSKPSIEISKTAQRDSLMLKSTIAEAEAKVDWFAKNKTEGELSTGLSDFEIESHEFAMAEKLKFFVENKEKLESSPETNEYFKSLQTIAEKGYLKDFIYDQALGIINYPEGESRRKEYKIFTENNSFPVNLTEQLYRIYY